MKIAIFSDTFPPQVNGVASQVYYMAEMLADRGQKVCVFVSSKKIAKDKDRRFQIVRLPSVPAMVYKGERLAIPSGKAYRFLKKFKPDIIHTHTPFSIGIEAVMAAKWLNVPLVGTHHTFFDHYLKYIKMDFDPAKKISWKIISAYYNRCDLVLGPTQISKEEFMKNGIRKPIEVLSNAIDTNLFCPKDAEEKTRLKEKFGIKGLSAVYMGRLSYEKSIDVVIRAFATVAEKRQKTTLMLIGDGPEKNKLDKLSRELGIRDRVIFTGTLLGKELAEALGANDIFVTASKTETFGIAVLEGMATGLPVVAVAEKSFPELINDEINGYLVAADDPNEMAGKIITLFDKDDLRKVFSLAARKNSLKYSGDRVFHQLYDFYSGLIVEKPKVFLYLEFYHFLKGFVFKKMGTGILSSYDNQKSMLSDLKIPFTENWSDSFEVIVSNSIWPKSLFLIIKAKRKGRKVIVWSHSTAEDIRGFFRIRLIDKLTRSVLGGYFKYGYGFADILLCPSEYNKRIIISYGISEKKLFVQSNGVDTGKFYVDYEKREALSQKKHREEIVIGSVGIVIPRKGVDTFLSLAKKFPNNQFVWYGKKFNKVLISPIPDKLDHNVSFTGYVEDINGAFNSLDIFFFPAYEENQGMVVLEAAAVGLPILVRDIPVYEGWLKHGENCLKAKDDAEFEKYLKMLIEDKSLREKLGKNALLLAEENSLEAIRERFKAVIEGTIAPGG